jgi:hypothetical protein
VAVTAIAKMAARGIWSKWPKIGHRDTEDDRCGNRNIAAAGSDSP